jgi:outer membrane protein OmpA-like peptidoglycan-associated protein
MDYTVGIEVEHSYFAQFIGSSSKKGSLTLTTLEDSQRRAIIPLYLFRGNKKRKITDITITNLPRAKAGSLKIDFRGRIEGKELIITAAVPGKPPINRHIEIPNFTTRPKVLWPLLIFLVLVLLGSSLFVIFNALGQREAGSQRTQEESVPSKPTGPAVDETATGDTPDIKSKSTQQEDSEDLQEKDTKESSENKQEMSTPEPDEEDEEDEEEKETVAADRRDQERENDEKQYIPPSFEAIYFGPNSAVLQPEAKGTLRRLVPKLNAIPENTTLVLRGHTAPYGTEEGRIWLSRERAESVLQFLRNNGMKSSLNVTIEAMGISQPVTQDPKKQHLNRRVTLKILPRNN